MSIVALCSTSQLKPIPRRLISWSHADVIEWLEFNNVPRKGFAKQKINGRELLRLSSTDVYRLVGDASQLSRFLDCLRLQWDQVYRFVVLFSQSVAVHVCSAVSNRALVSV
jgi:hypothetical protein